MEDLYIKWETGYMNIHMDFFFPCSQQRFKKLLKVIALDWQHEDELPLIQSPKQARKFSRMKKFPGFGKMKNWNGLILFCFSSIRGSGFQK